MLCLVSVTSSVQHTEMRGLNYTVAVSFSEQETKLRIQRNLYLPSPTGVCPVEEFMHGSNSFPPHGGNIATGHDGIVHARVHGQFLEGNTASEARSITATPWKMRREIKVV